MANQWSVALHELFLGRHFCRLGLCCLLAWLGCDKHTMDNGLGRTARGHVYCPPLAPNRLAHRGRIHRQAPRCTCSENLYLSVSLHLALPHGILPLSRSQDCGGFYWPRPQPLHHSLGCILHTLRVGRRTLGRCFHRCVAVHHPHGGHYYCRTAITRTR